MIIRAKKFINETILETKSIFQMVRNMGFPCAHVTIHFQVHVSAAIAFSRIEGTFSPKKEKVR
jgi:hypothetical protein